MYKPSKEQVAIYGKRQREKYKNDDTYRLNRLLQQARIRAKKRNLEFNLTINDLLKIIPPDRLCPVLGIPLNWGSDGKANRWNSFSLDRLDPKGPYTKDNVVIISWRANKIKGDCTIDELECIVDYMKS